MDYSKIYDNLMNKARSRCLTGYRERHHIVPKCLGGTNNRENIVDLTAEEHYLAHQLLVRIFPENRNLLYAAQLMTVHSTEERITNKLYGWIRRRMARVMSMEQKKRIEQHGHPRGYLGKKHSAEVKKQIAMSTQTALRKRGKAIYIYGLDGSFEKAFDMVADCARYLGTNASNVKYTAEGRFAHCKQRQITYEKVDSLPPYTKPVKKVMRSITHQNNLTAAYKNNKAKCSVCGVVSRNSAITRYHKNCQRKSNEKL